MIFRLIVVYSTLLFSNNVNGFTVRSSMISSPKISVVAETQLHAASHDDQQGGLGDVSKIAATVALTLSLMAAPAFADGQTKDFRLPPIDFSDKSRCTLNSSKMGQANAARDKLYDLRMCDLSNQDASGYDLSGVIMTKTNMAGTKLIESYFSKGYLHDSNFDGADFTNGIIDRASFKNSSLRGAIFANAVLTGTSFEGADVENADFTEMAIGEYDLRNLCRNPSLKGENPKTGADTYLSAGCGGFKK